MSSTTVTVRLPEDLAAWLEDAAKRTGVPKGRIIRQQIERARAAEPGQRFMRLAGQVRASPDLSRRKGFSRP